MLHLNLSSTSPSSRPAQGPIVLGTAARSTTAADRCDRTNTHQGSVVNQLVLAADTVQAGHLAVQKHTISYTHSLMVLEAFCESPIPISGE